MRADYILGGLPGKLAEPHHVTRVRDTQARLERGLVPAFFFTADDQWSRLCRYMYAPSYRAARQQSRERISVVSSQEVALGYLHYLRLTTLFGYRQNKQA